MVTFDARLPGTSLDEWRDDARRGNAPTFDLPDDARVLVVAAHPDDETLGAGGLIAECSARGIPLSIVFVTDGAASHPTTTITRADLSELRRREAVAAVASLAPAATVTFLGFPDGGTREDRDAVRTALGTAATDYGASVVVSPWRGDGHRDHRVVGEVCADVCAGLDVQLLEYPIWLWHWASPDSPDVPWDRLARYLPRPDAATAKLVAIHEYRSQTEPLADDEPVLHPDFVRNFETSEEWFVMSPRARAETPLPGTYFDAIYERRDDPWGFDSRWYEKRKRSLVMGALPEAHYGNTFEIGCSTGALTEQLAQRSDRVLGMDIAEKAIERARERLAGRAGVELRHGDAVADYPAGEFDLVVLSEVGYYCTTLSLARLVGAIERSLTPLGTLVACHWRHPVADYPLGGDEVHAEIRDRTSLHLVGRYADADFVLEVYCADARSVAEKTGLL